MLVKRRELYQRVGGARKIGGRPSSPRGEHGLGGVVAADGRRRAPPRRAPEPHSEHRATSVWTPHCWAGVSSRARLEAHGHSRSPWKMWPPGIASSVLDVLRDLGLDAGLAVGVAGDAVDRAARRGARPARRSRAATARSLAPGVAVEQRGRGVQAEVGERVGALRHVAEDRRVGQRVAVDLAGHRRGHPAGRRVGVRRLELGVVLGRRGACRRTRRSGRSRTSAGAAGRAGS